MTGTGLRLEIGKNAGGPMRPARRVADFVALLKPRPMSVVVFTAIAGLLAAPQAISPWQALVALLCIAIGGGGSAVLNMWFERDLDSRMVRTAGRPIPAGRVSPGEALLFAVLLIGSAVAVMALVVGHLAALMLSLTILFYGVVYTMWLKRATPLNVVLGGGLASILTPLTGWASASGALPLEAFVLFAFLVPWTPPHVWSQALVRAADYRNAEVPMMPVVAGSPRTRKMILAFTMSHAVLALAPVALGTTGWLWLVTAIVGGAVLTIEAARLARLAEGDAEKRAAWAFYRHNSIYVAALFAVLIVERALGFFIPVVAPLAGVGAI
jgi:protoheme IX farnesyltransferase